MERWRAHLRLETVLFTAFLAFVYLVPGDSVPWGEYFAIWPSLLWAVGLLALCALGFSSRRWKASLVPFAALAVFLALTVEWGSVVRGILPGRDPAGSSSNALARIPPPDNTTRAMALRLVSWNVAGGHGGEDGTLAALAREKPDLCLLQETPDGAASFLARPLTGYFAGFHVLDSGDCAVVSRFPMRVLETKRIGTWEKPQGVALDLPSSRTLLVCNVRLELPSLRFDLLSPGNRDFFLGCHRDRVGQFPKLARMLTDLRGGADYLGVILAGDFNTPGGAASLRPLRALARDVWEVAGVGWGATMTNEFPVSRIDQCWVAGRILPLRARVATPPISDHRMLVTDLLLD